MSNPLLKSADLTSTYSPSLKLRLNFLVAIPLWIWVVWSSSFPAPSIERTPSLTTTLMSSLL